MQIASVVVVQLRARRVALSQKTQKPRTDEGRRLFGCAKQVANRHRRYLFIRLLLQPDKQIQLRHLGRRGQSRALDRRRLGPSPDRRGGHISTVPCRQDSRPIAKTVLALFIALIRNGQSAAELLELEFCAVVGEP